MFGGPDYELREYVQNHVIGDAATQTVLMEVLIEHGLITSEQLQRRIVAQKALCDQEYQSMKEEAAEAQ